MSNYIKTTYTTCTSTWKPATPKKMVEQFTYKLNKTPKWKFIKRLQLRRYIKYWSEQINKGE